MWGGNSSRGGCTQPCDSSGSAPELAEFYSAITDWAIDETVSDDDRVQLVSDAGASLGFQRVEEYQPPQRPGQEHPQQEHLDFEVDDLETGEVAVLSIGARKHELWVWDGALSEPPWSW